MAILKKMLSLILFVVLWFTGIVAILAFDNGDGVIGFSLSVLFCAVTFVFLRLNKFIIK